MILLLIAKIEYNTIIVIIVVSIILNATLEPATVFIFLNSLRSHIGVVHQNNYIFKGSILYNVTYGINRDVIMDQVIEACKKCCIYDFIISLPEGFNTDVGPNGLKLSGGQQQRIALTRIFLRDPDIIILDEAT